MIHRSQQAFYGILSSLGALLFLFGSAGALLMAPGIMPTSAQSSLTQSSLFFRELVSFFLPQFSAYVFSFSSLGVFALPCLLVWQGYALSLQAVSVCGSVSALFCTAGIPNLIAVPCFFAAVVPAFLFSLSRFRQALGRSSQFHLSRIHQFGILLITLSLLSLCALYRALLAF